MELKDAPHQVFVKGSYTLYEPENFGWSLHFKQKHWRTWQMEQVWHWPWTGMVKTWVLHIALIRWTCDPSFTKPLQAILAIVLTCRRDGQANWTINQCLSNLPSFFWDTNIFYFLPDLKNNMHATDNITGNADNMSLYLHQWGKNDSITRMKFMCCLQASCQ